MTRDRRERRTILVIDEDLKALETTRTTLEGAGFRVSTRHRSAGSISAIVKDKPEIVLVELNIERLNGETLAKILNRTHPRPNVTLLFHSSLPVETLRLKALAAGAQGYVQKTADPVELVRRLEHALANAPMPGKNRLLDASSPVDADDASPRGSDAPPSPPRLAPETFAVTRRDAGAKPRGSVVKAVFVDDDWSLLRAYRAALGSELDAEFLTSGEDALQRILSDSPPEIVVCDIVMPFVTGADLYSRAVAADASWSDRFLFLTGASSTRVVIDFMNEHEGRVLFKPVPPNRLLEVIRQMQARAESRTR